MFRTIRKKKNEISIDTAKALLQSSRRGVLAVNGDDGYPYAIPINYVYDDDAQKIYFHGARAGHKVVQCVFTIGKYFTVFTTLFGSGGNSHPAPEKLNQY